MISRPRTCHLIVLSAAALAAGGLRGQELRGAVYLMTNQPTNAIIVYSRTPDGALASVGSFPTGGAGNPLASGNPRDPLSSQGSLIMSQDSHLLFAVNAGSNDISVMALGSNGLTVLDKKPSGGQSPVSLTVHGDLLYVLNAGGTPNITGFVVSRDGTLIPLPGSTRPISGGPAANPAQVGFSPDGDLLVVTEIQTGVINTYTVGDDGLATGPVSHKASGMGPFGFTFIRGNILITSEAFGGAAGKAAASSYTTTDSGNLQVVSGSVPDNQTAACWTIASNGGRFAYVTNTASGTISGYRVDGDGKLTLLKADGVTAVPGTGTAPIDMAVTDRGRFLYAHLAGSQSIVGYRIGPDGSLTEVTRVSGLPMGAQGIAAR